MATTAQSRALLVGQEREGDDQIDHDWFTAALVDDSPTGYGASGVMTLELASSLEVEAEVLVEVQAIDETQSVSVTLPLGLLGAGATRSFELPLAAIGLRATPLHVGGIVKVLPRLRLSDGVVLTRAGGPLAVGYHFARDQVKAYGTSTRTREFSGGRLDGSLPSGEVMSPARVTKISDTVGAARPADGEPDPDHASTREAP